MARIKSFFMEGDGTPSATDLLRPGRTSDGQQVSCAGVG